MNISFFLPDSIPLNSDVRQNNRLQPVFGTTLTRDYLFRPEVNRYYMLDLAQLEPAPAPYRYEALFVAIDDQFRARRITAFVEGDFGTSLLDLKERLGPPASEWNSLRNGIGRKAGAYWHRSNGTTVSLYDLTHLHKQPPLLSMEVYAADTAAIMSYGIIRLPKNLQPTRR